MPFKTRKQKESAASRNYKLDLGSSTFSYGKEIEGKIKRDSKPVVLSKQESYSYVFGEITKIAILTFAVIAVQIALKLYFGNNLTGAIFQLF